MALKLSMYMYHRVLDYYQDCTNDDLGLTLTFSRARSNMGKYLYIKFHGSFNDAGLTIGN